MTVRSRLISTMLISLAATHCFAKGEKKAVEDARAAISARQAQLLNLSCEYDCVLLDTPDVTKLREHLAQMHFRRELSIPIGPRSSKESFSVLGAKSRYEKQLTRETKQQLANEKRPAVENECWIFSTERTEVLATHLGDNRPVGSIEQTKEFPEWTTLDLAIGLRAYRENRRLEESLWENADAKQDENGNIVLSSKRQNGELHSWAFDPKLGFALISYSVSQKTPILEITCTDFKRIGGIYLPSTIQRVTKEFIKEIGTIGAVRQSINISVRQYHIAPDSNTDSRYLMVWPKGSAVIDARTGRTYNVKSKKRSLDDGELAEIERKRIASIEELRRKLDKASSSSKPQSASDSK